MDKDIYNESNGLWYERCGDGYPPCLALDEEMLNRIVRRMAAREDVAEHLKASDQLAWVGAMNNIRARVEETVNVELIYN